MHQQRCVCASVPRLDLRTRVILVMHQNEVIKPSATGPLALACLPNSERLIHGVRDQRLDLNPLFETGSRVLVLYPGEGARVLDEVVADGDPRPITLIVPDGNWRQAQRAARRVPGVERAEPVVLGPGGPTEWGIRLETKEGGLATFEAIARALGVIEGAAVEAAMMNVFRLMVRESWEMRGAKPILPEPAVGRSAGPAEALPDTAPLSILFDDDALVVINKPAGTLVHRGWGDDEEPLLQRLRDQLGQRLFPIHRLDRATSGALLFGKSSEVARILSDQFVARTVVKRYIALCRGHDPALQLVDHPLAPEKGDERKSAVTQFRLLGHHGRYGLYEATPLTGRVHQIRRHLKHASHPIIGDVRYGKGEHNRIFRDHYAFHRLALHCFRLEFVHPRTGRPLSIQAPLSAEFATLLDRLSIPWDGRVGSARSG